MAASNWSPIVRDDRDSAAFQAQQVNGVSRPVDAGLIYLGSGPVCSTVLGGD